VTRLVPFVIAAALLLPGATGANAGALTCAATGCLGGHCDNAATEGADCTCVDQWVLGWKIHVCTVL
jgi:hypothetical protein